MTRKVEAKVLSWPELGKRAGHTFAERKAKRIAAQQRPNLGPCIACAGSGRYDSDGSPPCGSCDGTGIESDQLSE